MSSTPEAPQPQPCSCPLSPEVQRGLDIFRKVDRSAYSAEDMPEYPARVLIVHVLLKGLQMGSLLGLVLTPCVASFRKKSIAEVWRKVMPLSASVGTVSCGALLSYKASTDKESPYDVAGVDDRAYRLHKHEGQRAMDKYALVGGLIGGGFGGVFLRSALVASTTTGIGAGTLVYGAEKAQALDLIKKRLKDWNIDL